MIMIKNPKPIDEYLHLVFYSYLAQQHYSKSIYDISLYVQI